MERLFSSLLSGSGKGTAFVEIGRPWNAVTVSFLTLLGSMLAVSAVPSLFYISVGMVVTFIVYMAASGLNDVYDFDVDRINMPFRPLQRGKVLRRSVLIFSSVLYSVALIVSLLVSFYYFLAVFLMAFISMTYSLPPFAAKDRPVVGNFVLSFNMIFTSLYAGYVLVTQELFPTSGFFVFVFLLLFSFLFINMTKDFKDIVGDKIFKKRTTVLTYGNLVVLFTLIGAALLEVTIIMFDALYINNIFFVLMGSIAPLGIAVSELMLLFNFSARRGEAVWSVVRVLLLFLILLMIVSVHLSFS